MPGLSDTHSRLAYLFYRSDDGDNAIADARTALSLAAQLDPDSPLAHHYLAAAPFDGQDFVAAETEFLRKLSFVRPYAPTHGQ
jgi:cytochrome c-type biogenesis protein CcmH/NrfG